jgi:malonyl-CoA decarboxylase
VALMRDTPDAIAPILGAHRATVAPDSAVTATFYSISNCQRGLAGVTFGHFLIKQVVEEISREFPRLSTFVTLSPVPNFATWLGRECAREGASLLADADRAVLAGLDTAWWKDPAATERLREPLLRAAATYFLRAKNRASLPLDPVARFHLGNGASLERLNWPADLSGRGCQQSHGLMVNYLYDLGDIERNHEAYAEHRTVVAASAIRRLVRAPASELVPVRE